MGPALHLQEDVVALLLAQMGHEDLVDVSDEAASKIANRVLQAVNETNLEERRRKIIGYAESDPDVTSIGVDFQPRPEVPVTKISREQFASYDRSPPVVAVRPSDQQDVAYERNIDVNIEIGRAHV